MFRCLSSLKNRQNRLTLLPCANSTGLKHRNYGNRKKLSNTILKFLIPSEHTFRTGSTFRPWNRHQAKQSVFLSSKKTCATKKTRDQLQHILSLADLVKFAKYTPLTDDNNLTLMNAYFFVNQTKKEEMKAPEKTAVVSQEVPAEEIKDVK